MKSKMPTIENKRGLTALIAVILIASGLLAFSVANMESAFRYADSVNKREMRITALLEANSCLDAVELMAQKDYFMKGLFTIPEFDCTATVANDFSGHFSIGIKVIVYGVTVFLNKFAEVSPR